MTHQFVLSSLSLEAMKVPSSPDKNHFMISPFSLLFQQGHGWINLWQKPFTVKQAVQYVNRSFSLHLGTPIKLSATCWTNRTLFIHPLPWTWACSCIITLACVPLLPGYGGSRSGKSHHVHGAKSELVICSLDVFCMGHGCIWVRVLSMRA